MKLFAQASCPHSGASPRKCALTVLSCPVMKWLNENATGSTPGRSRWLTYSGVMSAAAHSQSEFNARMRLARDATKMLMPIRPSRQR